MAKSFEVLITSQEIQKRVEALGAELSKDYKGKELVVVGVLKGAFLFMADLVRHIEVPLACDFLRVASYENNENTGTVRMDLDMTQPVKGKDVLLVEDIVDSGNTLKALLAHMKGKEPASLKVCSLLFKDVGTHMKNHIDYVGFTIPQKFVVGYGLDDLGLYRSLPYVGVVK